MVKSLYDTVHAMDVGRTDLNTASPAGPAGPTVVALVADSDDVAGFRAILRDHSLEHKVVVYVMQGTDGYQGASRRGVYVLGGHLAQIQSAEFAPRGRRIDWCIWADEDNSLNAPALAHTLASWDAQNPLLLANLVENDVPGGRILGPTIFSAGAWHLLHRVATKLRQDHPSRPTDIEADGSWFRHALPLAQSRLPSGEAVHFGAGRITALHAGSCYVVVYAVFPRSSLSACCTTRATESVLPLIHKTEPSYV